MFEKLFGRKAKKDPEAAGKDANTDAGAEDMQHAVAALLVEAARADNRYDEQEKAIIDKSLCATFEISTEDAMTLRAAAEKAQKDALDIQRFTRIAKAMSKSEKIAFVERVWEIVLSDGERDAFEDTFVRRLCGLIYLEDKESGAARSRVEARLAGP